jgi:hypothetical protein
MKFIFYLLFNNDDQMNTPVNITKFERLLNWAVTIGVAAWQAVQYILLNHPVK